jgi:EAL domain-containing protein (putative c-di-GMP-specific phosphodiesterase class I)
VFCQALDDLVRWQEAFPSTPMQVAINMSALQLRSADSTFASVVIEITGSSLTRPTP